MNLANPDIVFLRRVLIAAAVVLIGLSSLNLTSSSIGLHVAGDEPASADVLFGELRPIRSDEWNRGTPVILGSFLDSWSDDALTPFEERDLRFGVVGEVLLPAVVYPERVLTSFLPSRVGFFMFLWIPPVVAVAAVASMLRLVGVGRTSSVAGGVATALGPASAWWSHHGAQLVWPAALATTLMMLAWSLAQDQSRRQWRLLGPFQPHVLLSVLAGVLLARYPLLYAPWAIPTVAIFGALIIDLWRSNKLRRRAVVPLVTTAVVAALTAALSVVSQSPRLAALAGTSYPAARRFAGGSDGMPIFTGAHSYYSQTFRGTVMTGSNLSEAAVGPVILVVVALTVAAVSRTAVMASTNRTRLGLTSVVVAVLMAWAITEWPTTLSGLNPLSVIPGYRVAQVIGVIAIPYVWIVISRPEPAVRRSVLAAGVGSLVLIVSAAAGVSYRQVFPLVTVNETWFAAISLAAATAYFVWRPSNPKPAVPLALFIFLSAAWVNPIVRGVGDLYDSTSAARLRDAVATKPARVASDQIALDALLIANAIPTLGGQLNWGPDEDAWQKLDPESQARDAWNRGASSVQFQWDPASLSTTISAPYPDVVMVETHPCNSSFEEWDVGWIVSSQPLMAACLVETMQFTWAGLPRWLYEVSR